MNHAMSVAIERFIAENGVRRFEPGARSDPALLKLWLADRGYDTSFNATGSSVKIRKVGARGRQKTLTKSKFYEFVDDLRMAEGLEPLARRVTGAGTFKSLGVALQGAFK